MDMDNQAVLKRSSDRLGVFGIRNFFYLWVGQSASTFGERFTEIAIPILVYQYTGSAFQLGLAYMIQVAASVIFGLFAGALCDRWDRRITMIVSDLLRFGLVLCIPLLSLLPLSTALYLTLIYALIFLSTVVRQFFLPAKVSLIPEIVPEKQLMAANSVDQSSMKALEFVGYGAAGFFIEVFGPVIAFIVNAATYLFSALMIVPIQITSRLGEARPAEQKSSVLDDVRRGVQVILDKVALRGTLILSFLAPMAIGATAPLMIVYADRALGVGPSGYAMIEATIALGLALGVVVVGRVARDLPRTSLLYLGLTSMGIFCLIAYGLPAALQESMSLLKPSVRLAVVLPSFFLSAVANGAIFLGLRVIVQEQAPQGMVGRVFSVINVASSVAAAVGAAFAGMAELLNVSLVLVFWSVFLIATGLLASRWSAFRRSEEGLV